MNSGRTKEKKKEDDENSSAESVTQSPREDKKAEERVTINARIVHEAVRREGEDELNRAAAELAWSGLAAGLSMGFSLVAEGLLAAYLPPAVWSPLITNLGYSVGFLIVVLGRQQLFTENTLTVVLPLLLKPNARVLAKVARLWSLVLASNLVGAYLFASCIGRIPIFDERVQQSLASVSREALGGAWWIVMLRAVFAGWLIALMVWLLPAAESSRMAIVVVITYLVGLAGFGHIIAGSSKMFFLMAIHAIGWKNYALRFFAPVLIGNILGGVSMVACLGHAQVASGKATS